MIVRPESPLDIEAIRRVNVEAFKNHPFSQQTEHLIVEALRAANALDISLVADLGGSVVGHIAFSQAQIGDAGVGLVLARPSGGAAGVPASGDRLVRSSRRGLGRCACRGAAVASWWAIPRTTRGLASSRCPVSPAPASPTSMCFVFGSRVRCRSARWRTIPPFPSNRSRCGHEAIPRGWPGQLVVRVAKRQEEME